MGSATAKASRPPRDGAGDHDPLELDERDLELLEKVRSGAPFDGPESGRAGREFAERLLKLAFVSISKLADRAEEAVEQSASLRREISRRNAELRKSQAQTRAMIEDLING